MTDPIVHLRLAGAAIVLLGIGHAFLPTALRWSTGLAGVSVLDRQVAYVHSAYIGLTCVLLGLVPLVLPERLLVRDELAVAVLVGLVVFWGSRLLVQLFVYDRAHWRGNAGRTALHIGFVALWLYETTAYGLALAGLL